MSKQDQKSSGAFHNGEVSACCAALMQICLIVKL